MRRIQQERIYRNVYRVFAVLLAVSALLMFFMSMAPFGISASWSGQDLVITRSSALSEAGTVVGRGGALTGQIELFTVTKVFRENGELSYSAIPRSGGAEVSIPAREAKETLVATLPVLGYVAYALSHPIGVLALIGIPVLTFALDVLLVAWAGGARTRVRGIVYAMKNRKEARRERKARAQAREMELEREEAEREEKFTEQMAYREEAPRQSIKRNSPETYGMTIKLTRPQRYGMNMQ